MRNLATLRRPPPRHVVLGFRENRGATSPDTISVSTAQTCSHIESLVEVRCTSTSFTCFTHRYTNRVRLWLGHHPDTRYTVAFTASIKIRHCCVWHRFHPFGVSWGLAVWVSSLVPSCKCRLNFRPCQSLKKQCGWGRCVSKEKAASYKELLYALITFYPLLAGAFADARVLESWCREVAWMAQLLQSLGAFPPNQAGTSSRVI